MSRNEYPDGLTEREALKMLLASIEKVQFEMGGVEVTRTCTGLLTTWDNSHPAIHYLERNMGFARIVLERANVQDKQGTA